MALYTTARTGRSTRRRRKARSTKTQLTQVGRALARLGIEHIPAYSPQARGRSERLNRTFQDRLVNELRVAKITTLAAANAYLRERFIPDYNATFSCAPADPASAFVAARPDRSRADPLSPGGAGRRARQHRGLRGRTFQVPGSPGRRSSRACRSRSGGTSPVRRSGRGRGNWATYPAVPSDRAIAERRCSLWKLPAPWTPRPRPPHLGKRPNRVSHSSHRPHLKSGQITCQTKRTDHGEQRDRVPALGLGAGGSPACEQVRPPPFLLPEATICPALGQGASGRV